MGELPSRRLTAVSEVQEPAFSSNTGIRTEWRNAVDRRPVQDIAEVAVAVDRSPRAADADLAKPLADRHDLTPYTPMTAGARTTAAKGDRSNMEYRRRARGSSTRSVIAAAARVRAL